MRRAVIASLLSLTLALFLAGCGAPASEPATDATDEAQSAAAVDDEQVAEEEEAIEESQDDSESEDESEEEFQLPDRDEFTEQMIDGSDNDTEKPYERGVIDGDTYRNAFFGAAFSLPEDYAFATDDQLVEIFGEPDDLYTDEGIAERLGEGSTSSASMYCDMFAINSDNDNIMFVVWKAPTSAYFTYSAYRASDYRDDMVDGYNAESEDSDQRREAVATTVEVDGDEWAALDLTITNKSDESVVYQRSAILKCGFHYLTITMSSTDMASLDEMTAHLSAL